MTIDEHGLEAFRADHLEPGTVLDAVERDVRVLLRLPVGVGKSHALDALLRSPETYRRFDLVVYAAATWSVIDERPIVRGTGVAPVPFIVVRPRPRDNCGALDPKWLDLESRGCAALAKARLCTICPHGSHHDKTCGWPRQLANLSGIRLVISTQEQLRINRSFVPMLRARTGAARVLVLLDEGRLVDASLRIALAKDDLHRFGDVLKSPRLVDTIPAAVLHPWQQAVTTVIDAKQDQLADLRFVLPPLSYTHAVRIQRVGDTIHGQNFRNVAFDLGYLVSSEPDRRWVGGNGDLTFVARPYLEYHTIIGSAHHSAKYVAHRLGVGSIASPHETVLFRHSGTRIVNLRSSLGTDRYFVKNSKQILDVIAVLLARNIVNGRSTVLVAKKQWKTKCAQMLGDRLARWGFSVQFATERYDELPKHPEPCIVPVLHYGIMGVNDFAEYDAAYCATSFYVPSPAVHESFSDTMPEVEGFGLTIESVPDRIRRAYLRGSPSSPDVEELAQMHLRMLEVDPVVQVVGRVRFMTKPREVLFFAMHDFAADVGPHQIVRSLAELREVFDLPEARDIDHEIERLRIEQLTGEGMTAEKVAEILRISRSTVFNRRSAVRSGSDARTDLVNRICARAMEQQAAKASS